jgi:hypothetical protein
MPRRPLLGFVILVLLLGAYGVFWWIVAGRIEEGIVTWAESLRRQNAELTWRAIRVGGFPLAFDIRLTDARLRGTAIGQPSELRAPSLSASARPWNFRDWRLAAPEGLNAAIGPGGEPLVKLTAGAATGAVAAGGDGDTIASLTLSETTADLPEHITADKADLWFTLPARPPQSHTDRALGLAADLRGLRVPLTPTPFQGAIDDLAFGATVLGAIPAGPPRVVATAWRDAGGTVELDRFALRWADVAVNGSGTMALGPDLQPIGAFSGAVSGLDELLKALATAGQLRMGDLTLARIGLAALAKPGPNGKPEVSTSFTIQNGQMYLGPLKLGPAPRINWQ